jgi:SAM-dependent methyltransferase
MKCRHCHSKLSHRFLDLGYAPPSNALLKAEDLQRPELTYPLRLYVCTGCWLVQTEDFVQADELFDSDYVYFSSVSSSWMAHARKYAQDITQRLSLNTNSFVVELACNDGYLLRNFLEAGIPCLGIEPTASTAAAAEALGIRVLRKFFGESLGSQIAAEIGKADLIIGNNVYAHVPDINDFTVGMQRLLKPEGTITLEFPHLMRLIEKLQFDTVYHEHYSYLSLFTVSEIFKAAGLRIYDVEELSTHGGSLRVFGCHEDASHKNSVAVSTIISKEQDFGLRALEVYSDFQQRVDTAKNEFLAFLIDEKRDGRKVAAYGAAAKGCTLSNYAGIRKDLITAVYDAAPSKQNKFLPGVHLPVLSPDSIALQKPETIVIFPRNIAKEISKQLNYTKEWNARLYVALPKVQEVSADE